MMENGKKPPEGAAGASFTRWAVARDPAGLRELTIYDGGAASTIGLTPDEADFMALTLLADGGDDFDAESAMRRLLALAGQIVTHSQHDFSLAEFSKSHDVIGNTSA